MKILDVLIQRIPEWRIVSNARRILHRPLAKMISWKKNGINTQLEGA